jgi:hypothetical protein
LALLACASECGVVAKTTNLVSNPSSSVEAALIDPFVSQRARPHQHTFYNQGKPPKTIDKTKYKRKQRQQ